jgi:hypothetical protein
MSETAAKVVTARKSHRCDAQQDVSWFRSCTGRIEPGDKYIRMVCFPGDTNSSGWPWVMRACPACASGYDGPAGRIAREVLAELRAIGSD